MPGYLKLAVRLWMQRNIFKQNKLSCPNDNLNLYHPLYFWFELDGSYLFVYIYQYDGNSGNEGGYMEVDGY